MAEPVKSQILSAIAATADPGLKAALLLLLQVVEEIGGKIDGVLANEQQLRQAVLNGHALDHDRHHEWVSRMLAAEHDEQTSRRRIRDGVIEKLAVAALSSGATWLLIHLTN